MRSRRVQEPVDSIRKASQASPARGIVIHYFLTVSKHIGNRRVVDGCRKNECPR